MKNMDLDISQNEQIAQCFETETFPCTLCKNLERDDNCPTLRRIRPWKSFAKSRQRPYGLAEIVHRGRVRRERDRKEGKRRGKGEENVL